MPCSRLPSRRGMRLPLAHVTPRGCEHEVAETLPVALDRIVRELNPDKVILFGSYASGSPTADSDVDLLVVMDSTASSTERSWAVSRLLMPRPFPVDILVRSPREIEHALANGDPFVHLIMRQGRVLYERRA